MRQQYVKYGVNLGWLIGPENKIMMVYQRCSTEEVQCVEDTSWRDFSGGDVLPEFLVEAVTLDMVLNQEAGSSDEEELEETLVCPYVNCRREFRSSRKIVAHSEWHRSQIAIQKYLQNRRSLFNQRANGNFASPPINSPKIVVSREWQFNTLHILPRLITHTAAN